MVASTSIPSTMTGSKERSGANGPSGTMS
jgi:hypothetical protein